jgi:hypothetical protein
MPNAPYEVLWLAGKVALCTTVLLFGGSNPQQGDPQNPAPSATNIPGYFPPTAVDGFGDYFSAYLSSVGEPSLLAATQDPSALSYRLDWLSAQHGYVLAVRISVKPDGSATLTSVEESGTPAVLRRTQSSVSGADGKKFLKMVDNSKFWSMPAMEQENPDPRRRVYKRDASTCLFEGVRNGSYHVVFRQGLEPSRFTEMVRFLTKDLASLDKPALPHASATAPANIRRRVELP